MEKEEDEGCRWPEDMERRRIAALQRFQRKNPDFMHFLQLPSTNKNGSRGEKSGRSSATRLSSALARKGKPSRPENRWCLATSLELLEQMKVFVRANKLPCLGECMVKWKAIAVHLSNPCGLELKRLARSSMRMTLDEYVLRRNVNLSRTNQVAEFMSVESQEDAHVSSKVCTTDHDVKLTFVHGMPLEWRPSFTIDDRYCSSPQVRFDNLRRTYRAGKLDKIEVELLDSMIEYFKILELYQTSGSKKSSLRPSTMDLALSHKRSSASARHTRARVRDVTGKFCRRQTPMEGGELLHGDNHDPMPSGDESIDCSDDDDNELLPTWEDLETQIRMLPPPADEREPIDKEDAGGNYGPRSQVDRNRLRPTSVPGTRTAYPLLRGSPGGSSRRTWTF